MKNRYKSIKLQMDGDFFYISEWEENFSNFPDELKMDWFLAQAKITS
jgi:hypothetical protein